MATPAISVEGAADVRRTFRRIGVDASELTAVHREVAALIVGPARALAPYRSGRLAGSIRPRATRASAKVAAGGKRVPYARVQEYGWPARGIVAHRFMERALAANRDAAVALYRRRMAEVIAKAGRGAP